MDHDDEEDENITQNLALATGNVFQRMSIEEPLTTSKFDISDKFVKRYPNGADVTVRRFQSEGFSRPICVLEKEGLGMKVPCSSSFGIGEVRSAVGSRRLLDVMNVNTQTNLSMTMKEWHKYYDTPVNQRQDLYNVISLEFSNTKLDNQVTAPRVVRQIDWIDKVWPRHLKEMQVEATNSIDDMMYPKVQKYCLMSVQGCWTDFHIDLGGTSVWYHILKGKKTFFLIPPVDANLRKYEEWVLSGKQSQTFFGDLVEDCCRIDLCAGNTFFIPSGWIHAVYTPEDSLVFGGNFIHSFAVEKQLQVAHIEEVTRVPQKFRFPFFTEMLWYMLDRYVHCLYGRTHLDLPEEEKRRLKLEKGENIDPNKEFLKLTGFSATSQDHIKSRSHVHLTPMEITGIKYAVMYLHYLPASKKNVPLMLPDPIAVIKDIRQLVLDHKDDSPEMAVTGKYVLRWTESDDVDHPKRSRKSFPKSLNATTGANANKKATNNQTSAQKPSQQMTATASASVPNSSLITDNLASPDKSPSKKMASGNRRRRVRCKMCEACLGGDCRLCVYCKDMTKYGGPGRMKQTCEKRRCLHPQLPVCAYCSHCGLDGWFQTPKVQGKETERPEEPPALFECTVCLDIMHPECAEKTIGSGRVNNGKSLFQVILEFQ